MTSVIFIMHKKTPPKRGFFLFRSSDRCAPGLAKGLMLGRQRPYQRIVLTRLLGGRELDTVRDEAHLRTLLINKVTHLNQLLGL